MSHTILSLLVQYFDIRVCLERCAININGETVDCVVEKDNTSFRSPTYTVRHKETNAELCTFRPYHLVSDGPILYLIRGASRSGGHATLIVPNVEGFLEDDAPLEEEW